MILHRRTFTHRVGAGLGTLSIVGITAAADRARYLVLTATGSAGARIERSSSAFELERTLADGRVHVVRGPTNARADLERIDGVNGAVYDRRLAFERPAREAQAAESAAAGPESTAPPAPPARYDDLLWDKQRIDSLEANAYATGEGTSIGIIDTGIDYAHPELEPNLAADAGRLFREGEVRSGVDEVAVPDDYEEPTELETREFHVADDQEGHGTHVAGIAAAAEGEEVIGTAPDATLVALRVFWWTLLEDEETDEEEPALNTTTADVLTAIEYAAAAGLDVANLSLGTAPIHPSEMRDEAIRTMRLAYRRVINSAVKRGTVVVSSTGNDETDLGRRGRFSLPNSVQGALSISATGPADELAYYSDYGRSEVDVAAPGGGHPTEIETVCGVLEWLEAGEPMPEEDPREPGDEARLWLDEDGNVTLDEDEAVETITCEIPPWPYPFNLVHSTTSERIEGDPYGWKAGTSMAAPQVAGLAALVRELEPEAKPNRVESAIKRGAEGSPGRSDPDRGAGRINALETVERLQ